MPSDGAFTRTFYFDRPVLRPTLRAWVKHGLLLLLTFVTATIAGTLYPFGHVDVLPQGDPASLAEVLAMIAAIPSSYAAIIAAAVGSLLTNSDHLIHGLSFSISLLFILVCHEMGHYVACRLYRVDATLPFFIPTPPMVGPAGTFGAFIKILSPLPSRRAVFDIGVAGPIAGFAALIPIAVVGISTAETASAQQAANYSGIVFSDPLLIKGLAWMMGIDTTLMYGNAFYYAAWIGLLVTALNLIPSGQLDGGHAVYAVFGKLFHRWTGRIAFVVMTAFSCLGLIYFNSPSGFLIAILLGVMMFVRHPEPWDDTPLDGKRLAIAGFTLLIFALSFVPFPIKLV